MTLSELQFKELDESMKRLDREDLARLMMLTALHMRPPSEMTYLASREGDIGLILFPTFEMSAKVLQYLTEEPDAE